MTSFIKLRIYFKKKNAFSSLPYRCWGSSATVSLLSAVGTATLLPALTTQTLLKHFHRQSAFSGQVGRRSHNYFSALVQGLGGHRVARVWFGFLASSVWGSQPDNAKKAVVWPALQSQQSGLWTGTAAWRSSHNECSRLLFVSVYVFSKHSMPKLFIFSCLSLCLAVLHETIYRYDPNTRCRYNTEIPFPRFFFWRWVPATLLLHDACCIRILFPLDFALTIEFHLLFYCFTVNVYCYFSHWALNFLLTFRFNQN